MPFLIVGTIEKGSKKLSICPEGWVDNGILSWPAKKTSKKCKIEQLIPKESWLKMPCIIKRKFDNYEAADAELNAMLELPDTENEGNVNARRPDCEDFNKIAQQLSSTAEGNVKSSTDDVPNGSNIMTQNMDCIETEEIQVMDYDELLRNQKILSDNQVTIIDNQIKIIKTLATLSVKIDNLASNGSNCQKQQQIHTLMTVTPLSNEIKKSPFNARASPIKNIDDLQNMENQLRDPKKRKFLKDLYSVFCTPGKKGEVCAFQLIDVLFSREFLVECSWSGSARGASSKICIKIFQEVLGFFFELVHDCDPTYTVDKNNDFFKSIVKNAKKRSESKLGRASAPRHVPKRKLATKQQSSTTKIRRSPAGPSRAAPQEIEIEIIDKVASNNNNSVLIDENEAIEDIDRIDYADEGAHQHENENNNN